MHTHAPIIAALAPASAEWIGTQAITESVLRSCHGLVLAPGSPYAGFDQVLAAIAFARTKGRPFLGICGGFQHTLIEYARSVLALADADSSEHERPTAHPVIVPMVCRLDGAHAVHIVAGTKLAALYGTADSPVDETYFCGFAADAAYEARFEQAGLRMNARASDGMPRGCELPEHPFFMATAFQPQMRPHHPVIRALVEAAQQRALQDAWATDVTAEDYEQHMENTGQAHANAELSGQLLGRFARGRLLIAGAGPGQMLEHGPRLDRFHLTFTDVNARFLERVRKRLAERGLAAETVLDDLTASQLVQPFDVALLVLVLEHIDWRRALRSLARLAPDWLIIIQRNPAGMATAVTPGVLPPGSMRAFATEHAPHLVDEGLLTAAALELGYRVRQREERPVRDGKAMIGLHFTRVVIS